MLIRPMDLQVMLPRAGEAGKMQQAQEQQNLQQPQLAGQEWKELTKIRQGQVQHSEETEQSRIKDEQRERSGQQKEQDEKKAKDKKEAAEETPPDPVRGHKIDIRT